jgi:U32 family peptidase
MPASNVSETANRREGTAVPLKPTLPELLAPAGDWDCVKAAVENGADAIYFGLEKFNARMRADNFTESDLPKLMAFLHGRGVKGYVTFNTLVFESELQEAEQYARTIIASGVDTAAFARLSDSRLDADDRDQRGGGGVCPRAWMQPGSARTRMFIEGD